MVRMGSDGLFTQVHLDHLYSKGVWDVADRVLPLKASADYTARCVGSLVADAYRTLLKGGIFLYPRNRQQPDGGLRLMLEVNPHALLIEQAGGMAITGDGKSPLTIVPKTIDDRASLIMGSRENVEVYAGFLNG